MREFCKILRGLVGLEVGVASGQLVLDASKHGSGLKLYDPYLIRKNIEKDNTTHDFALVLNGDGIEGAGCHG